MPPEKKKRVGEPDLFSRAIGRIRQIVDNKREGFRPPVQNDKLGAGVFGEKETEHLLMQRSRFQESTDAFYRAQQKELDKVAGKGLQVSTEELLAHLRQNHPDKNHGLGSNSSPDRHKPSILDMAHLLLRKCKKVPATAKIPFARLITAKTKKYHEWTLEQAQKVHAGLLRNILWIFKRDDEKRPDWLRMVIVKCSPHPNYSY
jgi:hypothetical protein